MKLPTFHRQDNIIPTFLCAYWHDLIILWAHYAIYDIFTIQKNFSRQGKGKSMVFFEKNQKKLSGQTHLNF